MLNKALLSSPKEFRVSIGTQTYCTASVNKSSAMPGDLVTVTVRSNTGYGNVKVAVSPSVEVTKVNETTFTFVMPFTNVVVSASASALDFRINVSKTGQGTVTVKSLAKYGETVTVTVAAGEDYVFGAISSNDVSLSGSGDHRSFVMPAKDVTLSVAFNFIYPGYTTCHITVGKNSSLVNRSYGYKNGEFGNLEPKICNNLYTSTRTANTFDRPMYLNGIYYDNNMDADTAVSNLYALVGQTLKCYVKSS